MNVKYLGTHVADEGLIRWYTICDEKYGFTSEGAILDAGGHLVFDEVERRHSLRQIAKFEAFK
jgi:hypothetical protein